MKLFRVKLFCMKLFCVKDFRVKDFRMKLFCVKLFRVKLFFVKNFRAKLFRLKRFPVKSLGKSPGNIIQLQLAAPADSAALYPGNLSISAQPRGIIPENRRSLRLHYTRGSAYPSVFSANTQSLWAIKLKK